MNLGTVVEEPVLVKSPSPFSFTSSVRQLLQEKEKKVEVTGF